MAHQQRNFAACELRIGNGETADVTLCRNGFDSDMLCQQSVAIPSIVSGFLAAGQLPVGRVIIGRSDATDHSMTKTSDTPKLNGGIYARVSTDKQDTGNQLEQLRGLRWVAE